MRLPSSKLPFVNSTSWCFGTINLSCISRHVPCLVYTGISKRFNSCCSPAIWSVCSWLINIPSTWLISICNSFSPLTMRRQLIPTSCNITEFPFFITVQLPLLPLARTWTSKGEVSLIKLLHIINYFYW